MNTYSGHIDRAAFERNLRLSIRDVSAEDLTTEGARCQYRGNEAAIQFALFVADELNQGTDAKTLIDGGSRLLGNMLENLARGFEGVTDSIIADILDRIRWQTTEDESDVVVISSVPHVKTGRA